MKELVIRFFIGGLVVSFFAVIGDVLKPKTFAGLFGAAPSVALATLGLTIAKKGSEYAAVEARSMIFGAVGLLAYSLIAGILVRRFKWESLYGTLVALPGWAFVAVGCFALFGGDPR